MTSLRVALQDIDEEKDAAPVVRQKKNNKFVLSTYSIYESEDRMYIVASNKRETMFRILEIDLTVSVNELAVLEDNVFFTRPEIMDIMAKLEAASSEGLSKSITGFGLLGFIRFTSCYYLIVITKCSQVAIIGGHSIYHIDETQLIPIMKQYKKPEKYSQEAKLIATFQTLELSKTFYFSYTYDITHTLQTNLLREKLKGVGRTDLKIPSGIEDYNAMFVWNSNLLRPIFNCIDTVYDWFLCIIHGFIDQVSVSILSNSIYITLIARRSRHCAGARFLKRGVNSEGYVANEVETEQIVADMSLTSFHKSGIGYYDNGRYTSFVQHRGSIPLYWTQAASNLTAKPPIHISLVDPYFSPAAMHFDMLFQRYGGGQIDILNLIKRKERAPREMKLLRAFEQCIQYLNQFLPNDKKLNYESWDMSRASKQDGLGVIEFLENYAIDTLRRTGIFQNSDKFRNTTIQQGICRTNCIDCLDRTNAAQFVIGKRALGIQLKALGIIESDFLPYDSDIVNILTELFHDLGDTIALQYGGSHLVNTMETYRKINHWSSHSRDLVESIKRFYSNSFVDAQRQDAINLFLGNYLIKEGIPCIGDMQMNIDYSDNSGIDIWAPKLSYTHWWNDYHLKSLKSTIQEEIIEKGIDLTFEQVRLHVRGYPEAFDNYWNEYYSPRLITWMEDLFAYNMNSTRRYKNSKKDDQSPFVARKQSSLNSKIESMTQCAKSVANEASEVKNADKCLLSTPEDELMSSLHTLKLTHYSLKRMLESIDESSNIDSDNESRDSVNAMHCDPAKKGSALLSLDRKEFDEEISLSPSIDLSFYESRNGPRLLSSIEQVYESHMPSNAYLNNIDLHFYRTYLNT